MSYVLKWSGSSKSQPLTIAKEEFCRLREARGGLLTLVAVEEKLDLLVENYVEYELELLKIAQHASVFAQLVHSRLGTHRNAVNRRLVNLLSSSRLYVDQVKHEIRSLYGKASSEVSRVDKCFSARYDSSPEYRVMEALRNYVQHRSLPIHWLACRHALDEPVPGARQTVGILPYLDTEILATDKRFKRSVLKELRASCDEKGRANLTQLARRYVEDLAKVHDCIRSLVSKDVSAWEAAIGSARQLATDGPGTKVDHFSAIKLENDKIVESVDISASLIRGRKELEQKHRDLGNLSRRYVSNR